MLDHHPTIEPSPRRFHHFNHSNPSSSWGDKFELQCVHSNSPKQINFLIGDSHIERLSSLPALSSLFQRHFSGWLNHGIGGDRIENVAWRLAHGSAPSNPGKAILCMGTNNLRGGKQPKAEQSDSKYNSANCMYFH